MKYQIVFFEKDHYCVYLVKAKSRNEALDKAKTGKGIKLKYWLKKVKYNPIIKLKSR